MKYHSKSNTTWFVTRHSGAKEWAAQQGLTVDRVVDHLKPDDVRSGDKVLGSLPVNLVAELNEKGVDYFHLILPLPPDLRGKEITAEMMTLLGAKLEQYTVKKEVYMMSDKSSPNGFHLSIMAIWHKKWVLLLTVFAAILGIWFMGRFWEWRFLLNQDRPINAVSFILAILTFSMAAALGLRGFRLDWEKSLPQKLTVFFMYGNEVIMRCDNAYLAHEGDIRNWGQQIGRQMVAGELLDFGPNIVQSPRTVKKNERGEFYVHFQATFDLQTLPKAVQKIKNHADTAPHVCWSVNLDNRVIKNPPPDTDAGA